MILLLKINRWVDVWVILKFMSENLEKEYLLVEISLLTYYKYDFSLYFKLESPEIDGGSLD